MIPGKGPMGGEPPFRWNKDSTQYLLGETSGTTIVNDMQEPERKRRTGKMRAIGGKTHGFEKRPSRC